MRFVALLAAAFAAGASAQPYPYPPQPLPPAGAFPPAPQLALPVLEADFRAKAGSDTVRFERDSYVLGAEARTILTAQANWLRMHPFVRASIEGHGDGRQSRDYALALGERRAAAVRNFLLAQGVPPGQISIVSWGRERPAVEALHDAAWLQNSRVVTVLKP